MHYDIESQIMSGNYKFIEYDINDNIIAERIRPLKMRQSYKQELKYLIELCGFRIVKIYGDYHFSEEPSMAYVWLLQKI